jgi:hypothetical protein
MVLSYYEKGRSRIIYGALPLFMQRAFWGSLTPYAHLKYYRPETKVSLRFFAPYGKTLSCTPEW